MNGPNDPPPFVDPKAPKPNASDQSPYELHACQGLNACKGHGRNNTGTMAGDGDCATANDHDCGTGNDCRGQGGCGYAPMLPNENACRGAGGCGSPIPTKQNFDKTTNSVWAKARAAFEARMTATKNPFAPAPQPNALRDSLSPTTNESS